MAMQSGDCKYVSPCAGPRIRRLGSAVTHGKRSGYYKRALSASVNTLQLLQQRSDTKLHNLEIVSASAMPLRSCAAADNRSAAALSTAATLGILRCLPYEMPSLTARVIYEDSLSPGQSENAITAEYTSARRYNASAAGQYLLRHIL